MSKRYRNGEVDPKRMICTHCLHGACGNCIDIVRLVWDLEPMCTCTRANHSGEPRDAQVLDPDTGTVYGPAVAVTTDGEVERL